MKYMKIINCLIFVVPTFVQAQQLQSYINEADKNNENIKAYEMRYNIAQEKINEVTWLPNTEFSAGYFVSEPETRTGAQVAKFSAKQMLPWFGTVETRQNYASAMAEIDYVEYIIAKRKLALAVTKSYYQLYRLKAKRSVLTKNIELLKTYETLALRSIEVGKAGAVDVLLLQIRQNELQQESEILHEQILGETVNFNNLLNRDVALPIDVNTAITIPNQDPAIIDSLSLNPELLRFDKMFASVIQEELLNKKKGSPKIGFGLDYVPVQERPNMVFDDNGKDIVMPMVSVSIPIFNKQYRSVTKQNELRKQEITFQQEERLHRLESLLAKSIALRNKARISFNTQDKNLKRAKDAEQILMKNYETGTVNFNDLLDIQELQLKFEVNQINAIEDYYVQSSMINYLSN